MEDDFTTKKCHKFQLELLINYYIISRSYAFGATIFLYLYGDITNSFCFDKNTEIGNKWHSVLHFISSIGHHAIVLI